MTIPASNAHPVTEVISLLILQQIMPRAKQAILTQFHEEFNLQMPAYAITTPLRIAAFIAQGAHESGELNSLVENMNYTAPRIVQVWPSRFRTVQDAQPYANNPEKLGNNVYANRMGNGAPETGDGYRYRGRGWFNGTGKGFYQKMTTLTGVDFVTNPDLFATPKYAVMSACVEWNKLNLNPLADVQDFKQITLKINGGYTGLPDRTMYYERAKKALGIPQ